MDIDNEGPVMRSLEAARQGPRVWTLGQSVDYWTDVHLAVFMLPDEDLWQRWTSRKASALDEEMKRVSWIQGRMRPPNSHVNQRHRVLWAPEGRDTDPRYERYREAPWASSAGSSKTVSPFDFAIFLPWFWFSSFGLGKSQCDKLKRNLRLSKFCYCSVQPPGRWSSCLLLFPLGDVLISS